MAVVGSLDCCSLSVVDTGRLEDSRVGGTLVSCWPAVSSTTAWAFDSSEGVVAVVGERQTSAS